jgi:hypothetical protein
MNDISIVALFCSDVRQEKGGTETIVGVFPDNVNIPSIPSGLTQMCVYVRMHVRPSFRPNQITTRLVLPDGTELDRSEMEMGLVDRSREKAIASKSPYVGLIARFVIGPMPIAQEGRLQAIVSVDGADYVAGALNFRLTPATVT